MFETEIRERNSYSRFYLRFRVKLFETTLARVIRNLKLEPVLFTLCYARINREETSKSLNKTFQYK